MPSPVETARVGRRRRCSACAPRHAAQHPAHVAHADVGNVLDVAVGEHRVLCSFACVTHTESGSCGMRSAMPDQLGEVATGGRDEDASSSAAPLPRATVAAQ